MFLPSRVTSTHGVTKFKLDGIIVRRNGKIVWKHVPNGSFCMLMLRTKLYLKSFFSTVHQNINKQNSHTVEIVNSHLPCYVINIRVFSCLCQDTNMAGSTFVKKMLQLFKETNWHYIKHRIEGQTSRSLNSFSLFSSEIAIK